MIDKLIQFSIARRWLVMFLVAITAAVGVWNYQKLPIDAVPDITNVQVQINTEAPDIRRLKSSKGSPTWWSSLLPDCLMWKIPAQYRATL